MSESFVLTPNALCWTVYSLQPMAAMVCATKAPSSNE